MKSCRILLAACLSASWLAAASAHANTITVTNTNDSGPGSLRQAMADANDGDTINAIGVSGSVELSSGELLVNRNLTINGPGAEKLSVENVRSSRVFEIASGEIVTISGLAINNGQAVVGGGVYNAGILEVTDCSISGNEAGGPRENGLSQQPSLGGGIYNDNGATLIIINCTISANGADQGGGIYNAGTLDIVNSTITSNAAGGTLQSGGIGGGIFNGGTLAIVNTTISGNLAGGGVFPSNGRGIANVRGNVIIQNSTINGNTADGPSGSDSCGNVFIAEGTLEIGNTILNTGSGENILNFGNLGTIISDGYNLSSDNGAGYLTAPGDQINADPRLGPLQDNGGPTFTHALLADSPAIDAGNPNVNPNDVQQPLINDQRGFGFDRVKNDRSDIGAFELQAASITPSRPTPPPTPTATATPRPRPTPPPTPTPPPSPTLTPSPTPSPSSTPVSSPTPTPPPTKDPRKVALAKIRREMRFTRTALHKLDGTMSIPPSVFTWLKVRLRVLEARLAYPLDETLARIDRQILNGGPMSEASRRKLLARVNARVEALRNGR